MRKGFNYLALFGLLFVSCEEYYTPKLDVAPGMLVVESLITNDLKQNFVKLTMTNDFYNTAQEEKITGAKVELVHIFGEIIQAIETTSGYFTFPKAPVPGEKYQLRISWQNDIFESDYMVMPLLPTIDSLYTNNKIVYSYRTDIMGGPVQIETAGREICVDAPIYSSLEYYRFNYRTILQWVLPQPPRYGWNSFFSNGLFNIAGARQFSVSTQLKNHPIAFLGYDTRAYLAPAQIPAGWILILEEYGISQASYNFYEKLNKQFSAEGSLFDPVLAQVDGNIHCKTNPGKIVNGFFDLNSYRQYRYFLKLGNNENDQVIQRRLNRYPDIPDEGIQEGVYPDFWENYY
jgi:hypothetical protein